MKKNLIKLYVLTLLVSIMSVSCEEFLEDEILDQVSEDYIYSTIDGLEVGVNGLYNRYRYYNMPAGENNPLRSQMFFMAADDLGQFRTYMTPYQTSSHTPAAFPDHKWVEGYKLIDKCNAIIQFSVDIEGDQNELNFLVAQAKVIRAEIYLDLIRMYDNILLDTTATTPENADIPIEYVVADPEEVFALIDSDLDFAIANLAYDEVYGRYNKAVARHLKGKSAMWRSNWTEAASQFDKIITESGKSLVAITDVFGQNLNHNEMLFAIVRDQDLGSTGAGDNLAGGAGTWIGSAFVNRLYEDSHGYFINKVEHGGQALGWAFPNDYLEGLYDHENDLRYTTYYYDQTAYVANNPSSARFGELILPSEFDDNHRRYHFSLKKFYDEEKGANTNDSWKDYPMYRLAETHLLGAEAHHNLGEDAIALEYINKIRRRAYGLDYNAPNATVDFTEWTLDTYLEESARELAMERNRWFLLKRLGLLVERQNLHYRFGANDSQVLTNTFPMAEHMVSCPIPQNQIDLMGTFPQNPGY